VEAAHDYKRAADQNDVMFQFNCAVCLAKGEGIDQGGREARYVKLAAGQNDVMTNSSMPDTLRRVMEFLEMREKLLVMGVDKSWPQADRGRTGTIGDHRRLSHGSSPRRYPMPIELALSSGERRIPIQTSEFRSEIPECQ
jgi:hypothetical protein